MSSLFGKRLDVGIVVVEMAQGPLSVGRAAAASILVEVVEAAT